MRRGSIGNTGTIRPCASSNRICRRARALLDELRSEKPAYASVPLQIEDERRNRALADALDYWYMPCCFVGGKKIHEGVPSREAMRAVLDAALSDAPGA